MFENISPQRREVIAEMEIIVFTELLLSERIK